MSDMKGFDFTDEALQMNNDEFLAKLKTWHEAAKKYRQIYDWNWYIYQNYYQGNHYIQFNRKTNQITTPPRPKSQVRMTVNKIYSILRAIRNFATSYRPKWSVVANSTTEEEINSGKKAADTLDYYYDYLEIPKLVKGVTNYASKYGIGFWQYGWDEEAMGTDNQRGECAAWIRDPFDVYLDPSGMMTGDLQNCRFIDIAISKPIQDIKGNPAYTLANDTAITGDTVQAASEFKQILLRNQYSLSLSDSDELAEKILHEVWYKKRVSTTDEKTKETYYETEVWIASWIEGHLLRNEKTEFKRYPLIAVPSDDNPNEIYGEGYIKNLIPIIKVLNRLESQIVEYNNMVNRGRFIADKDSGVSKITNETGEIIEKNAGADVKEMVHGGLAPDIQQQIARMNHYLDEISGVTDAFTGNAPSGVTAGVALESLKAQTANNLQDLKDNVETALAQLGEGILELLANKLVVPRQIRSTDGSGRDNSFKIKGQVGVKPKEQLAKDTYVIGNQNKVKVIIGSGLAYTREGRVTRLDKLLENKVIDPQTYLENLEFGNVDEVIQRANQSQFNDAMLQKISKDGMPGQYPQPGMMPGGAPAAGALPPAQPPTDGTPPPQGAAPQQDSWTKLADDEDSAMLQGQFVPPTKGAPKEHTAIHIAWSQSPEVDGHDHLAKALLEHIKGEEQLQGAPHAGVAPPVAAPVASK